MDEASVVIPGGGRGRLCGGDGDDSASAPHGPPSLPPWTRHGSIPHGRQSNPRSNDLVRPVALETGTPPSSNHAPARRDEQVDRKHKGSLPLYPLHLSLVSSVLTSRPVDSSLLHSFTDSCLDAFFVRPTLFHCSFFITETPRKPPSFSSRLRQPLPPLSCHRSTSYCSS